MTTYTLTGFAAYYDAFTDTTLAIENSGITLEIVVPDTLTTFDYTLLPAEPGEPVGEADIPLEAYNIRLNGVNFDADYDTDWTILADLTWTDGVSTKTTTLLDLNLWGLTVPGLGTVDAEFLFTLAGDPLPVFQSPAQYDAMEGNLLGISEASGALAPGTDIPLTALGGVVTERDTIFGSDLDDSFDGGLGRDKIFGALGNDTLRGGRGKDLLSGDDGNDVLFGDGGHDTLFGKSGNDRMLGGNGDDILRGAGGRDRLVGGIGDDQMTGGAGVDTFFFNKGADVITDFGNDRLRLDDKLWGNTTLTKAEVLDFATVVGADTVFDFGSGNTLTLENYTDIAGLESLLSIF